MKWTKETQPRKSPIPNLTLNPNLAYILGVCYGDGSVCSYFDFQAENTRYTISLEVKNMTLAREFKTALEQIGLKPSYYFYEAKKVYRVRQYSKEFYLWFKGITFNKLKEILSNEPNALAFIRGFYESEGCLYQGKYCNQLSITNTNLELLTLIRTIMEAKGILFSLRKRTFKNPKYMPCYFLYVSNKKGIEDFLTCVKPSFKDNFKPRAMTKPKPDSEEELVLTPSLEDVSPPPRALDLEICPNPSHDIVKDCGECPDKNMCLEVV